MFEIQLLLHYLYEAVVYYAIHREYVKKIELTMCCLSYKYKQTSDMKAKYIKNNYLLKFLLTGIVLPVHRENWGLRCDSLILLLSYLYFLHAVVQYYKLQEGRLLLDKQTSWGLIMRELTPHYTSQIFSLSACWEIKIKPRWRIYSVHQTPARYHFTVTMSI